MDFFIKKGATLPVLKMAVVKDGRSDFNNFMDELETYSIYFSMFDAKTGIPKVVSAPADIVSTTPVNDGAPIEYYIYYQFTERETNKPGRYRGEFLLKNTNGDLILPLREDLIINVVDTSIERTKCC